MEPFETIGKIHYPEYGKDIIHEAKLFSNENSIYVEFDLPLLEQPNQIDFLWVEFNKYGYVTCVFNRLVGSNFGTGCNRCRYKIANLFTGAYFNNKEDLFFHSVIFRVNSLFEWFNIRTIRSLFGKITHISADDIYAINVNRKWCTKHNITTNFKRKGRVGKYEDQRQIVATELRKERATCMEGTFGTEKQHYSLDKIKARIKKNEVLWTFFFLISSREVS